jgi:hypothetical protein
LQQYIRVQKKFICVKKKTTVPWCVLFRKKGLMALIH